MLIRPNSSSATRSRRRPARRRRSAEARVSAHEGRPGYPAQLGPQGQRRGHGAEPIHDRMQVRGAAVCGRGRDTTGRGGSGQDRATASAPCVPSGLEDRDEFVAGLLDEPVDKARADHSAIIRRRVVPAKSGRARRCPPDQSRSCETWAPADGAGSAGCGAAVAGTALGHRLHCPRLPRRQPVRPHRTRASHPDPGGLLSKSQASAITPGSCQGCT